VSERRAPSRLQVVWAIARREIGIAWRRKLVKFLFFLSLLPPIFMTGILVVRVMVTEQFGTDLGWDPVLWFLRVQLVPVVLLALGLGTPVVARDRAEDVLYLYAVRPVTPWTYALGKMAAVMVPTGLLLFLPAVLIAVLRQGILGDMVGTGETLGMIGKTLFVSILLAYGYSGVSVGPSAATRRARWALLIAILVFNIPEIPKMIYGEDAFAVGPNMNAWDLLRSLIEGAGMRLGLTSAFMLAAYGSLGLFVTRLTVRREMTP
jgi:ABC-type transport system involved in multi-copper enzyme maturation permease subunit